MKDADRRLVERVERLAKHRALTLEFADVELACRLAFVEEQRANEQEKRARHAEAERDAFNTRIGELEAEQAKSWDEFEKEALDAIGSDVIGTIVDAGSDIPGMIRRLHERYCAAIQHEQKRRIEAEEQCNAYKRIANMKQRKDKP